MVVYRGLCDMNKLGVWPLPTHATVFMAPGKHFLTFPISKNKILNIVGFVSAPWEEIGDVKESWTLAGDKDAIAKEFKDYAPPIQTIIHNMDANPLKWILFDRESSPEWIFSGGKVTLLGDAAHAMCPHQGNSNPRYPSYLYVTFINNPRYLGAGAGQSLEDGYVIGRVLSEYFQGSLTLGQSLCLYHTIRYPRSERVQVTSRQAGDLYELNLDELSGLNYDDALPIVKAKLEDRMKWIWTEDMDDVYDKVRAKCTNSHASL